MNNSRITRDGFFKFIHLYNQAVETKQTEFEFNGEQFNTRYAYYAIDYMKDQIEGEFESQFGKFNIKDDAQ